MSIDSSLYPMLFVGIPLLMVIYVFIFTSKKPFKKQIKRGLILTGCLLIVTFVLAPSVFGIDIHREVSPNYDVPNDFKVRRYKGLIKYSERDIELIQDEPLFVYENEYRYEVYGGKFINKDTFTGPGIYQWHDAIGITVYDGDEIIHKELFPSMMSIDTLVLIDSGMLVLRTSTDEYFFQYVIEIKEVIDNGYTIRFSYIFDSPSQEYYIPYNHELIRKDLIDDETY